MNRRDDKKTELRGRLASTAAVLFAERGYDEVAVLDVARAAGVSEQTVYNYFPAKQDLVLDRAVEIEQRYAALVRSRPANTTPAAALRPALLEDAAWIEDGDPALARGRFVVQCLLSPALRRFALEFRERQAASVADAIRETDPAVPALIARAHAAALVAVAQAVTDAVGAHCIAATAEPASPPPAAAAARRLRTDLTAALDDLDRTFLRTAAEAVRA